MGVVIFTKDDERYKTGDYFAMYGELTVSPSAPHTTYILHINKFTEKDIRQWLSEHGYYGNSAKFVELDLHAIQRPGWLQVFRFQVEAKAANGGWETYFGAVRDDERTHETTIKTFRSYGQQQKKRWWGVFT